MSLYIPLFILLSIMTMNFDLELKYSAAKNVSTPLAVFFFDLTWLTVMANLSSFIADSKSLAKSIQDTKFHLVN